MASAIAMYFALSSTGETIYWYGGALVSLFHRYRAFKIISATQKASAKALVRNEVILITVTAVLVVFSTMKIVSEYFRIDSPAMGTCWGKADNGMISPVACWSGIATDKTIGYADAADSGPAVSSCYFDS